MTAALVLRDIHHPPAPGWWPPAPGWWWLAAGVVLVALAVGLWWRRRRRRRLALERTFEAALAAAAPQERLARMSELLRRAARRVDPQADRLQGQAWRAFLDRDPHIRPLADDEAAALTEGPFRPEVSPEVVARLEPAVRARFLAWMGLR